MMWKAIRILIDALLAFTVIALLPFAWLMRDGLGPDSSTSFGMEAAARCFMTFYTGPVVIVLVAVAVFCHNIGKVRQHG